MSKAARKKKSTGAEFNSIKTIEQVKLGVQDALDKDFSCNGYFASQKTYRDFPNPCLDVEELGHIGLPLSQRDADALISRCDQQVLVGTVVDTEVGKTLQLDPSKVSFQNSLWREFVDQLLCDAYKNLGVNYKPVCEFNKLLVYGSGSPLKSHLDTEKRPDIFATMLVVLPSQFTGGDVHLKHRDSRKVFKYNESEDSYLNITALSWYTGVFYEMRPIESGYCLALSYNLIHHIDVPNPIIPSSDVAVKKLNLALKAWATNEEINTEPYKLMYLLEHEYFYSGLKAGVSSLLGTDAARVIFISDVGKPLGFQFALVGLEYYVCANKKLVYDDDSDSGSDGGMITRDNICEEKIRFIRPVDLQGKPIRAGLNSKDVDVEDFGYDMEFIPEDFTQKIRDIGNDYKTNNKPWYDDSPGDIEQWYRGTVLVIWHEKYTEDRDAGNKGKRARGDIQVGDNKVLMPVAKKQNRTKTK